MENNWLTVNEIAEYLNISRSAVINDINRKELKSVHVGKRILIKEKDFKSFLAQAASYKGDFDSLCYDHIPSLD